MFLQLASLPYADAEKYLIIFHKFTTTERCILKKVNEILVHYSFGNNSVNKNIYKYVVLLNTLSYNVTTCFFADIPLPLRHSDGFYLRMRIESPVRIPVHGPGESVLLFQDSGSWGQRTEGRQPKTDAHPQSPGRQFWRQQRRLRHQHQIH